MEKIELIQNQILSLKKQLRNHKLYDNLNEIEHIQKFMEKHVYAVWDFMSLLKALQNELTCNSIPWKPSKNTKTARFINEIVLGEETDFNEKHEPKSHFDMYIDAMYEVGANPKKVLELVSISNTIENTIKNIQIFDLQKAEREFLEFTFNVIRSNEIHKIAAAFTFGREDLIPDMFIEIIENSKNKNNYPKLTYYLNRHIELDGDEHGPLSLEMIKELCGDNEDKWNDVLSTSIEALNKRIHLWDEITSEIQEQKPACNTIYNSLD